MRLHGDQKTELIRKVPLFARCSRAELKEIAKLADEIDLAEGKEMTREGAPGREFFVLLEGEIALVSHEPRTATVIASSPIRALVITDRSFRRLLDDAPRVKTRVMEAMAERLAPETL